MILVAFTLTVLSPAATATRSLVLDPAQAERLTRLRGCECSPSMTPDGRTLIYEAVLENGFGIYALDLQSRRVTQLSLQGKEGVEQQDNWDYSPVVSPDGKHIAYLHDDAAGTSIRVMPVTGDGSESGVVNLGPGSEGDPVWRNESTLIATQPNNEIAEIVLQPGGRFAKKRLAVLDAAHHAYGLIVMSDGRIVVRAAVEGTQLREWKLFVITPGSEALTQLRVAPPPLRFKGQFPTLQKDALYIVTGYAQANATLSLLPLRGGAPTSIATMPITYGMDLTPKRDAIIWSNCYEYVLLVRLQRGKPAEEITARLPDVQLRWLSRRLDGRLSVTALGADDASVRVLDPKTKAMTTEDYGNASQVVFSPDGRQAVFARHEGSKVVGLRVRDRANGPERVLTQSTLDHSPAWSADGKSIYFLRGGLTQDGATLMRISATGGEAKEIGLEPMTAFAFLSERELVFAGAKSQKLQRASLATRAAKPLMKEGGGGYFPDLKLSADKKRLLVLRGGKEALEHVLGTERLDLIADSGEIGLRSLEYDPDGNGVIAAARLWEGDLWRSVVDVP